jgi:hypothetical protein
VIVNDVEKPKLICPENIDMFNDVGQCLAIVDYKPPIGIDNCPTSTLLTGGFGNGSAFPIGINIEEYTTTDLSGNTGKLSN